jgi:hypothetical protein
MSAPQPRIKARGRLAGNDNETIVEVDEFDTEAHRLAANDNETTVKQARRYEGDDEEDPTAPDAARRLRR